MQRRLAEQDMRVSNAEREEVGALLTEHFAAGRLSTEEFTERADSASVAVTRSDLDRLLADLPGAHQPDTTDVLELVNTAGDLRRSGPWVVQSRIRIRSAFGNAHLDFRTARCTTPVVAIDVELVVGNLDIRLPGGATADLDGVRTSFGSVIDRTGATAERGSLHLVVRGGTRLGNVRVRR